MSLFNEKLKKITLKELLSLIIVLFLIQYFLNYFNIIHIESFWIYVLVILFFIFKLRNDLPGNDDFLEILSEGLLKYVLVVVVLNIFLSYGFLYLSDEILSIFQGLNFTFNVPIASNSVIGGLITTILVSPIVEELIFRGVFLNRLQLIVPAVFAILISSLIFASLHGFGSIVSSFVFGLCMALLYFKTNNIFVPIFAHFLNNLFAEIIRIIDFNNILFNNSTVVTIMSILAIISFIVIIYSIVNELKYINNNNL